MKMLRKCFRARHIRLISRYTVAFARHSASPTLYRNVPQAKKRRAMQTDWTVVRAWLRCVSFLMCGSNRLHKYTMFGLLNLYLSHRYSSGKTRELLLSLKTLGAGGVNALWRIWAPSSTGSSMNEHAMVGCRGCGSQMHCLYSLGLCQLTYCLLAVILFPTRISDPHLHSF